MSQLDTLRDVIGAAIFDNLEFPRLQKQLFFALKHHIEVTIGNQSGSFFYRQFDNFDNDHVIYNGAADNRFRLFRQLMGDHN